MRVNFRFYHTVHATLIFCEINFWLISEGQKLSFHQFQRLGIKIFVKNHTVKNVKNFQIKSCENGQNGTFGEALKWPKLISRKIWMTEKPWNFHSVKIYHFEIFSLWIFFLSILALKNARFAKILFFVVSKKCQNMYNFLKQWRLTHTNSKLFKIEFSFSCLFTMWIQNVPCKNQNP